MNHITIGFRDSTPLLEGPELLREQADEEIYIFFKSLKPHYDILPWEEFTKVGKVTNTNTTGKR